MVAVAGRFLRVPFRMDRALMAPESVRDVKRALHGPRTGLARLTVGGGGG